MTGVQTEIINNRIDRMLADRSLGGLQAWDNSGASDEAAMLQMAAHLSSMRPAACSPTSQFVARLRSRMLSEVAGEAEVV